MADILTLRCVTCNRDFDPAEVMYTCPKCGEVGTLDVLYDYRKLAAKTDRNKLNQDRETSIWRYRELLPIHSGDRVPPLSLSVGGTPLYDVPRIAEEFGLAQVWLKDDGRNPTGSLKDRASSLVVARAMALGYSVVSTASTGNAAAALAGIAASVPGIDAVIFVPAAAPQAKIAQLLVYGAEVVLIEDTYDVAFDICMQLCHEEGWYCRNTGVNPFTTEGKKTVSFEIAEQLGWQVPDAVLVSVGDGNIISGVYKGFFDLYELGWIERIPRIVGVQALGSSSLAEAWKQGIDGIHMNATYAQTIADSISAGLPRDRVKALRAVNATQGAYVTVSDEEIIAAIPALAQRSGVFVEPAAAAAFAGLRSAVELNIFNNEDRVLLLLTGNGLKDVKRAQQSVESGIRVPPDLDVIRAHLRTSAKRRSVL